MQLDNSRVLTVAIDVSSLCYEMLPSVEAYWTKWDDQLPRYEGVRAWEKDRDKATRMVVKAMVQHAASLEWLGGYGQSRQQCFFCFDWKTEEFEYWRHEWLRGITAQLPERQYKRRVRVFDSLEDKVGRLVDRQPAQQIAYKGGRDYTNGVLRWLKKVVREVINEGGYPQLAKRGYEADDIMATLAMVNSQLPEDEQHNLLMCCVDSDILGMVSDRVGWCCMHGYKPRLRLTIDDINLWRVEVKKLLPIANPEQIWYEKAVVGDKSDNLPPSGEDMATLPAIHLLNPPEQHRLWQDDFCRESILKALRQWGNYPKTTAHHALKVLSHVGLKPAIDILENS